jgi:hypothetical protein
VTTPPAGEEIVISWHLIAAAGSVLFSVICAASWLTWFISNQFAGNRRVFYRIISQHNREDDDRFAELSDAIWGIHLRNARRDGDSAPQRKSITRRRYLVQDGGDMPLSEAGG